ncbi:MAG: hypothetical protein MI975_25890, partial [Cytophagales bacterium]|nr:hypothetical protein [Cytophagales bacterium]
MLTKLLTPLNRLIGPDGLIPLIKASPWLLIPILAYNLANNYLNAKNEINKRRQTVEELMSIAEANPEMKGPIGYYLVRLYPQDKDQNMLLNYLQLVGHLSEKDSSQQQEHWQRSADLILNVRNYFGTGATYGLSRDYLKTHPVPKSILAKQMMLESEKHDHGIERFVRA